MTTLDDDSFCPVCDEPADIWQHCTDCNGRGHFDDCRECAMCQGWGGGYACSNPRCEYYGGKQRRVDQEAGE